MSDFVLNDTDSEVDSDEELQEAFAKGLLKPGLNEEIERIAKNYVNNVAVLKVKLKDVQLKLPWIETLDLVTTVAPMAPDVALQMQETAQRRKNLKENSKGQQNYDPTQDPVLNEFKRENLLHRQAQAAVLEGIKKLKDLGVATRRPDDYFAEMAKSDDHMQKVRKSLMSKQAAQARTEKVRQLRDQKKIAKRVQTDARVKQAADKKEMLEQLKRVRKGKSSDLGFLDDNKGSNSNKGNTKGKDGKGPQNKVNKRRAMKDKKFGFGGKKKGGKLNTRESSNNFEGFNGAAPQKRQTNFKTKSFQVNSKKNSRPGKSQRPGKSKRKNSSKR